MRYLFVLINKNFVTGEILNNIYYFLVNYSVDIFNACCLFAISVFFLIFHIKLFSSYIYILIFLNAGQTQSMKTERNKTTGP